MIARRCVSTSLLYVVRGYLLFNIRGAAVQHGDVRPPLGRRDHEVLELAALAARLNRGVVRGVHLEAHVPAWGDTKDSTLLYSLSYNPPYNPPHNKRR